MEPSQGGFDRFSMGQLDSNAASCSIECCILNERDEVVASNTFIAEKGVSKVPDIMFVSMVPQIMDQAQTRSHSWCFYALYRTETESGVLRSKKFDVVDIGGPDFQ